MVEKKPYKTFSLFTVCAGWWDSFAKWVATAAEATVAAVVNLSWTTTAALAAAAVVAIVWAGPRLWRWYLARPVNPAYHPFVRFPWLVVVPALGGAALRGEPIQAWWFILVAWGSMFLGAHFLEYHRRRGGWGTLEIPEAYQFSELPLVVAATLTGLSGYLYGLEIFVETSATPFGLVRNIQLAYGLYFLVVYLCHRWPRLPALVVPLVVGRPLTGVNFVTEATRAVRPITAAAVVTATGGVTVAAIKFKEHRERMAYKNDRLEFKREYKRDELIHRGRELTQRERELDFQVEVHRSNLALSNRPTSFQEGQPPGPSVLRVDPFRAGQGPNPSRYSSLHKPVTPLAPPKGSDRLSSVLEGAELGWFTLVLPWITILVPALLVAGLVVVLYRRRRR